MTAPRPRLSAPATEPAAAAALGPVREALVDHARAEADRLIADARADADDLIRHAEQEARELGARAAAEGESDAAAALATEQARARRRARGVVLAAEAQAYHALHEQAHRKVRELTGESDWPHRRRTLERLALRALGDPDAELDAVADGVRATSGSRSVTVTLSALADAAVDELGADVERLWRP